ncbi:uncharacterized protein LOC109861466 [Pseudomyrmex gracilis]|uniref:uncharacterized protein LOC109861466 n=1 Tax=Pseudomyrmex gracilis TaxID=219809 RepID=UPI00099552A8|nr:uncharacterized protein LOC109861466 [Pseudomyrmex gracilis]
MKVSIVERFNRTLKNDMWKQFTLNGTYKWIDILSRLLVEYNARKHRTIDMRPIDVTLAIADKLLITVYSNVKIAGPARFKVGDPTTYLVTYLLEDSRGQSVAGGFYEHELHRVANPDVYLVEKVLRKKDDKVYVKWLGLDKSYNSWIDKTNVL